METYYTKQEYTELKRTLERKIRNLEKRNKQLAEKLEKCNQLLNLLTK